MSDSMWNCKVHAETSDIRLTLYFLSVLHLMEPKNFIRRSREERFWNLREIREDE